MFRLCRQILIFIPLVTSPLYLYAHQPKRGKVIATWGPIFFQRQVDRDYPGATNPLGAGFMIAAEGDVDHNGGLEITLGYMQRRYFRKEGGSFLVEDAKRVHTSTGYRHWFNPRTSAALSLFTAYSIGDARVVHSNFAPGAEKFNTAATRVAEDGIDFSLQHELVTTKKTAILTDLRYSYSLSARGNESPFIYGFMVGFKHFIQGREADSSLTSQ